MRKLYPRRYELGDATFSRASSAYGSDGKLATTNVPRIDRTEFGKMVWVEEAATNLVPVANQKFVGWDVYQGAVVTLTQNQVVPEWGATDATRIQTNGGTHIIKYFISLQNPSVAGQSYSASLHIKNIGNHPVMIHANLSPTSNQTVDVGETTLVKIAGVGNGVNIFQIRIQALDAAHSLDFIAWRPMAEVKAYATSFIETSRAAESLTMPTAGLASAGTIEGMVDINDMIKRQGAANTSLFYLPGLAGGYISVAHMYNNPAWNFTCNSGSAYKYSIINDSNTPNGLYYYKCYWSTSEAGIEFWDLTSRSKVAFARITEPNLPSTFTAYCYLGHISSGYYANTRFGRHRLSNIARTTDPDFNNLMPRDSNTVAIFDPTYSFIR